MQSCIISFLIQCYIRNDKADTRTHVIESLGPTQIEDSCFINNQVSSAGVVVYGNQLQSRVIHSTNTGGALCQFASVFENLQQYKSLKPKCVSGDSSLSSCAHLSVGGGGGTPPVDQPVKHIVPFMTNALDYDEAFELGTSSFEGGCNRVAGLTSDGPDAQNTDDETCLAYGGCHVSHSMAGEYLVYKFSHNKNYAVDGIVYVNVMARMASPRAEKQFRLELMYNGKVEYSDTFASPGLGYKDYQTITWENVPLRANEATHSLRFWFVNGNINFCAIGVEYAKDIGPVPALPTPTPPAATPTRLPTIPPAASPMPGGDSAYAVPPITWSALSYYQAFEKTPETSNGGCNKRNDGVDAQPTSDAVCRNRDDSTCNIGWWDAEEYLLYRFSIPSGAAGVYDVRVRAASKLSSRHMGMEVMTSNGSTVSSFETFDVPGNGWQSFDDLYWTAVNMQPGKYILKIYSKSGSINVCSVAVLPSGGGSGGGGGGDNEGSPVAVPGFYSAMFYTDESNDSTADSMGNCPYRRDTPVDSKTVSDSVCKQATTEFAQHCNIAFTEANEAVMYDITNTSGKSSVKVTLRVASYRSRDLKVELLSATGSTVLATKTVSTVGSLNWDAYDTLTVWNSVNVGGAKSFRMKVTFLNGQVNFCAFGIE